jgi:hypothetical protein
LARFLDFDGENKYSRWFPVSNSFIRVEKKRMLKEGEDEN